MFIILFKTNKLLRVCTIKWIKLIMEFAITFARPLFFYGNSILVGKDMRLSLHGQHIQYFLSDTHTHSQPHSHETDPTRYTRESRAKVETTHQYRFTSLAAFAAPLSRGTWTPDVIIVTIITIVTPNKTRELVPYINSGNARFNGDCRSTCSSIARRAKLALACLFGQSGSGSARFNMNHAYCGTLR